MRMGISKTIVKRDPQIATKSVVGQSQASKLIKNLLEDIRPIAKYFTNIYSPL